MPDSCTSQAIDCIGASASATTAHTNDTLVPSDDIDNTSFKSVKRSLPWDMGDAEEVDGEFTLVQHGKKKSKQGVNPSTSANQTECQQPNPAPPQEPYRLFFPKGVSPRDRAIWLAEVANKHRNLSVQPRLTAKSIIAVTRDLDTVQFLTEIGHPYKDTTIRLAKITEENKQTKVVIRNYPSYMTLEYIKDLPSVLWVERDVRRDDREPRNQVFALWQGELPTTLQFPGMRPCKVERYVGKPAFCGNCQKWGHRVWQCDGRTKCGFCAGNHDSKLCREKIDSGENITPRCPNCYQEHNAWSLRCPLRPDSHLRAAKGPLTQAVAPPPSPSEFPPLSQGTHQRPSHLSRHQPMPQHTSPSISGGLSLPSPSHHSMVPHHPWPRHHLPQPPPQRPQNVPQDGARSHHQAPQSVPQTPAPPPDTTEKQPVDQPTDAGHAPTIQLLREVEALRREVKSLKDEQVIMQKENQDLKTICASQQSIQTTLTSEISIIKNLLTQLVADTRDKKQTCRDDGMSMETDIPPSPHHPQDSCLDLTLTAAPTDNNMVTQQSTPPHTLTHPGQPSDAQTAALPTPPCHVTQLGQPATLPSHADPTPEPASLPSQPISSLTQRPVPPIHHQPGRQRRV